MKKLTALLMLILSLVFTAQDSFAHRYSQMLKQSTELSFERAVLESNFQDDIKTKSLKGLVYELADWYKVNLIKQEALPKELRKKFKKYQAHLALLQFNGNQVVKNQILEEYRSLEGISDLSLDEVEQILLARIFKKHINLLESPDSTDAQKSAAAAIALRMLTEAYIAAATHKVKVQESKEQIEKTQDVRAIKRMVFVGSFVSLAGLAHLDNSGLLAQASILGILTSASAILTEPFLDDFHDKFLRQQESQRLIDVFWKNSETKIKPQHPEFMLRDQLDYLQKASNNALEVLVRKYRAMGRLINSTKCQNLMKILNH